MIKWKHGMSWHKTNVWYVCCLKLLWNSLFTSNEVSPCSVWMLTFFLASNVYGHTKLTFNSRIHSYLLLTYIFTKLHSSQHCFGNFPSIYEQTIHVTVAVPYKIHPSTLYFQLLPVNLLCHCLLAGLRVISLTTESQLSIYTCQFLSESTEACKAKSHYVICCVTDI